MGNRNSNHDEQSKQYNTSETHPMQVDYLPQEYLPKNSKLGMMMCPGRFKKNWKRNLQQDLERIRDEHHPNTIVTLVTEHELHSMNLQEYLLKFQTNNEFNHIKSFHFPIRDKSLPDSGEKFCEMIHFILTELFSERNVIVHCNGGKGRAATTCTAVLMAFNFYQQHVVMEGKENNENNFNEPRIEDSILVNNNNNSMTTIQSFVENASQAIEIVRTTRGGGTLQNPLQIIWLKVKFLKHYERFLRGKQAND